jgi:hypothetical protein
MRFARRFALDGASSIVVESNEAVVDGVVETLEDRVLLNGI